MSEPADCPGVDSSNAGFSKACQGCPSQQYCSQPRKKGEEPGKALVKEALKDVKQKVLIMSGKGGVGKSALTMLLARTFSNKFPEKNFGILDVDICGPSQPRMMGVVEENVHQSGSGWSPVDVADNLCVMSIGFLLGSVDDAVIWRGPKKMGMIRQFLSEVDWGTLDVLFLDTPPGTSDEHLAVINFLKDDENPDAAKALLVSTPHEMSISDVSKEINFCKKLNIPIIGVIENMKSFRCQCGEITEIFPAKTGVATMCEELNVPYLGSLPLDLGISKACESGADITELRNATTGDLDHICAKVAPTLNIA